VASLYKRGKTWWARAQRDGVERRQSLRTTVRAEAVKRLARWLEGLDRTEWGTKPRLTFRKAMEMFLTQHCPTIKPGAAQRYVTSARALFGHFEAKYLDQITRRSWAEYVISRRAAGVSPAAINRDRACLSKMFSVVIAAELADANTILTFPRQREPEGRVRFLTKEEYAKLLDAAPVDMRALIIVAANTGMRMGEIIGMTWGQVDFVKGEIHIPRTKTDEPRAIPMPPPAAAQISAQGRGIGTVFHLTKSKRPIVAVSQRFANVAHKAGIKDFTFHDLRHTFASWATKGWHDWQDGPMRRDRLQLWLGHKSPAMTQRYAHLDTTDLHAEMKSAAQPPAHTQGIASSQKEGI
jgi:integrase/recombinase XerD